MMDDLNKDALLETQERIDRWAKILDECGRSDDPAWQCVYEARELLAAELRFTSRAALAAS